MINLNQIKGNILLNLGSHSKIVLLIIELVCFTPPNKEAGHRQDMFAHKPLNL